MEAAQPPAEAENGVVEESSSNALEAFLDSAPDPFRARPPGSSKVRHFYRTTPARCPVPVLLQGIDIPHTPSRITSSMCTAPKCCAPTLRAMFTWYSS